MEATSQMSGMTSIDCAARLCHVLSHTSDVYLLRPLRRITYLRRRRDFVRPQRSRGTTLVNTPSTDATISRGPRSPGLLQLGVSPHCPPAAISNCVRETPVNTAPVTMDGGLSGSAAGNHISLTLQLTVEGLSLWSDNSQEREFARSLQKESRVQVSMPADNWPERSLTLSGSSDIIFRALIVIIDTIQENICSTLWATERPQPFITLRLRVPASQCIKLLQEADSRVRDICTHTGVQVHVCCGLPPGDSELSMTGWPQCVSECMKLICQILLEMLVGLPQERGWVLSYQPAVGPALQAGGHDQAAEGSTYAEGHFYSTGYSCSAGNAYAGSEPQAAGYPHSLPYRQEQPPIQPSSSHGLSTMFPFYGPAEQLAGSCSVGASKPPEEIIHEIMIPNSLIGSVIGFHGANISEIRSKSGARVKIFPMEEGSSLRLVRITGTLASIILAHSMVIYSLNHRKH